jgi:hypothetical protein
LRKFPEQEGAAFADEVAALAFVGQQPRVIRAVGACERPDRGHLVFERINGR